MPFPLARKLFHASGVAVVLVYWGLDLDRKTATWVLAAIVAALGLVDLARWRLPAVQRLFERLFRAVLERKDASGLNTSTLYFTGCLLAVVIAPKPAACGAILALALGDPTAAIIGSSIRSPKLGHASLAGTSACFLFSLIGCAFFFPVWPAAVAGAAAAALLEAVSGAKMDNLTIPAGTALVLSLFL